MDFEILVNKENLLDINYEPNDLIETDQNENNFHDFSDPTLKPTISASIYPFFLEMQRDMKELGLNIIIDSGYRSSAYQQRILDERIEEIGLEEAIKMVAPPGSSEHQTGLAFDIAILKNGVYTEETLEDDPEVLWLKDNAFKYGFILRYPKGKESVTKYNYEPWHYRYVGKRLANIIKSNDITLEEYYIDKEKYDKYFN